MKKITLAGLIILSLSVLSCSPFYLSNRFSEHTQDHQIIAVLPFEMQFSGVMPRELSEDIILHLEEAESQAFQISFYNELRHHHRSRRKALRVDIQDYGKTLNLLRNHQIEIRESWSMLPEELAEVLGVDAVVRGPVFASHDSCRIWHLLVSNLVLILWLH